MKKLALGAGEPFAWRSWGEGFVNVNDAGHLEVITDPGARHSVDLHGLVTLLQQKGVRPPVLVRFPQLIDRQLATLHRAFRTATRTFNYRGAYACAYPLKVNSRRATVARICETGRRYGVGLEVGTKAELCIALSMLGDSGGPIICNGYKDTAYIELAAAASEAGYNVVVVFERPREYELIGELRAKGLPCPRLGARVKLNASGMGRWEESSGDLSKFGLTASDLLDATRLLKECKLLDRLRLLHFHLGSQITNIRNFKQALQEALRFYVELKELGVPLDTLDGGGGLGVDYDGSNSSADSSVNYNVQEYANDIIYTTKEVLDRARITEPEIITEAGRFLVTHHAALLVDPLEQPRTTPKPARPRARASNVDAVNELDDMVVEINSKNWREYLHDAYQKKDEMLSAFSLGFLSLKQRAQAESAFSRIVELASRFSRHGRFDGEDKAALERIAARLHAFNFSIFRSLPDSWVLDMLFPIMPTCRLKEKPAVKAILADLTCDSDGVINKFSHPAEPRSTFELHGMPWDDAYTLAILFLGAYQEALSSDHNLFGRPAEVTVETGGDGGVEVLDVREPDTCGDMLNRWGFSELVQSHVPGELRAVPGPAQADSPSARLERIMTRVLAGGTYLDRHGAEAAKAVPGEADAPMAEPRGARVRTASGTKQARSASGS